MRAILTALLLLTALPFASAEGNETKPECPEGYTASPEGCSKNAWVEDCPPDMMCAYGNESCIECSGPVSSDDGASTCMDGSRADDTCDDDDVRYLDGRGPADCENCRDVAAEVTGAGDEPAKDALPLAAVLLAVAALAGAVLIARRN